MSEAWVLVGSSHLDELTRQAQCEVVANFLAGPWALFNAHANWGSVLVDEPLSDPEVDTLTSLSDRSIMPLYVVTGDTFALVNDPA